MTESEISNITMWAIQRGIRETIGLCINSDNQQQMYEELIKPVCLNLIKYSEEQFSKIEDKKNGLDWVIRDESDLKDYFRQTLDAHVEYGKDDKGISIARQHIKQAVLHNLKGRGGKYGNNRRLHK